MSTFLGDRHRFAIEVGDWDRELCRVDIWAAGQWLTCDDNMAFVRQLRRDVGDTAARLRSGTACALPFDGLSPQAAHRRLVLRAGTDDETEADFDFRSRFRVLDWGPTTDNVTAHLFRDGDRSLITLQFWRGAHLLKRPEHAGEIFVAKVSTAELVGILEGLVAVLDGGKSQDPPDRLTRLRSLRGPAPTRWIAAANGERGWRLRTRPPTKGDRLMQPLPLPLPFHRLRVTYRLSHRA